MRVWATSLPAGPYTDQIEAIRLRGIEGRTTYYLVSRRLDVDNIILSGDELEFAMGFRAFVPRVDSLGQAVDQPRVFGALSQGQPLAARFRNGLSAVSIEGNALGPNSSRWTELTAPSLGNVLVETAMTPVGTVDYASDGTFWVTLAIEAEPAETTELYLNAVIVQGAERP